VQKERQGDSTFQKVRAKKPSAKNAQKVQKTPRGFDLSKGPNQKNFGKKRKQSQKRQGASTFQKVRTQNN